MNRTVQYKLRYLATLVALGGLAVLVVFLLDWSLPAVIAVSLVLLIPGRIQGHYFRDLFSGRRALEAGHFDASVAHTEQFLTTVRQQPGIKPLIWLGGVIYTADLEAMALNNLGAAHLDAGRFDAAEAAFSEALGVDPLYSVPFYNLAVLSEAGGDRAEAERYHREAERLGYSRKGFDRVVQQAGALVATVEGRRPDPGAA